MWQDLFVNGCILITIIFITSQIFKNRGLTIHSPLNTKVILGVMGGIASIILIYYSIPITSTMILDFREMCIILVSLFGGIIPALITGYITMLFRLFYSSFNDISYLASIGIIITSIGCGILSYTRVSNKWKGWIMLCYSLVIRSIAYIVVLLEKSSLPMVLLSMWVANFILAAELYYFVQYLVTSHKLLKELKKESTHDYLTGLRNTRSFHKKYKSVRDYTMLHHGILSIMIIDIDHFKSVNDSYGHASGDMVLKEVGKLMKSMKREAYLVSRIGGEEFAVILKNYNKELTLNYADRIRKTVAMHKFTIKGGLKINMTVSIGVAIYPDTVERLEELMEVADQKLYEAKHSGRNQVCS